MAKSRICSIDGCGKAVKGHGWCEAHYWRWRKHGDPLGGGTPRGEPLDFLENTVIPFDGDECLIWPYSTNDSGYGQIWRDGKVRIVSRVVCEIIHGPPPTPKHEAAHSCGKGHIGCVTKRHLRWATKEGNQADRLIHDTHIRGERHANAKLTEAKVLEIRASTMSHRELAKEYGVTRLTVSRVKLRKTWAWLEDAA